MAKVRRAPGMEATVSHSSKLGYDCSSAITWVKDATQVIVVQGKGERCWSLQGVDAVIWDLLNLKYDFVRMVDFLATLLEGSRENAAATLMATMQHWEREGIVTANGRGKDG